MSPGGGEPATHPTPETDAGSPPYADGSDPRVAVQPLSLSPLPLLVGAPLLLGALPDAAEELLEG